MKLTIDFNGLATNAGKAMARVTSLFVRNGLPVLDVSSDGRPKRAAGITYREVVMTFQDSQKLTLRIKATGDVYQVLLNGRVTPVAQQDDPGKAVAELAGLLDKSRARFQKRMALLVMKPPEGARTAAPRLREALQQQVAELDQQIAEARDELAELRAKRAA